MLRAAETIPLLWIRVITCLSRLRHNMLCMRNHHLHLRHTAAAAAAAAAAATAAAITAASAVATTTTVGAVTRRIPPGALTPRMVVANPDQHLKAFIKYWLAHLPDLSEGKTYHHTDLQFWKNWKRKGRKDVRAEHRWLRGLCRSYTTLSTDFCISQNMWPVVFEREDVTYDMSLGFILAFWACYLNNMVNRPDCTTAVATTVLKYLLTNKGLVVRTWRSRLYYFGSATIFRKVQVPLLGWTEDEHGIVIPKYVMSHASPATAGVSPAMHSTCLACDTRHVSPAIHFVSSVTHVVSQARETPQYPRQRGWSVPCVGGCVA